jgi:hypothetical protein
MISVGITSLAQAYPHGCRLLPFGKHEADGLVGKPCRGGAESNSFQLIRLVFLAAFRPKPPVGVVESNGRSATLSSHPGWR